MTEDIDRTIKAFFKAYPLKTFEKGEKLAGGRTIGWCFLYCGGQGKPIRYYFQRQHGCS